MQIITLIVGLFLLMIGLIVFMFAQQGDFNPPYMMILVAGLSLVVLFAALWNKLKQT